ncbi:DMT family transporter [Clostridium oceanicum]|uniref:DMT family transporter n=1 Tax=Clostridium oceanicum TaxID=1543 RepID=A0ABN1JG74_9CLOT
MKTKNKGLVDIHLAVLLFGLSGLFGKLIALPPMIITLGRVIFSSIFLFIIIFYFKKSIKLKEKKHYFYLVIMGIILASHWTAFLKSIQVSTVAIGLLTFSTFPVFVTFLEPYFFKEKIKLSDVIVAIITFLGVVFVIPKFQLESNLTQGVIWGLIAGFTYAILSMLNRKYVKEYSSLVVAFYEQLIAAIVLLPALFFQKNVFHSKDILLLMLLGTVFTAISHTIFIKGLKNVKVQTAGIISSLEPIYAILSAAMLLGEIPTLREILGGSIILATVFYSTVKSK